MQDHSHLFKELAVKKTGECQQGEEHYYKKEARYTVSF